MRMRYEIRLTNVPDGAYTEDYLGAPRQCNSIREAKRLVAQFNKARRAHPENFEPDMVAEIELAHDTL